MSPLRNPYDADRDFNDRQDKWENLLHVHVSESAIDMGMDRLAGGVAYSRALK